MTTQELSQKDKDLLKKLARAAIEYRLKHMKDPTPSDLNIEITPAMKEKMGAFVTLKKRGVLRGCIGEIFPTRPLYKAVTAQAVNSAFRDPRFPPLSADELDDVHIEISALTQPKPVSSYNEIIIGKHGIVLEKYGRSAVFLPQVAPEQGWDLEQTLTHLSLKAGLPPDAWREDANFLVFEAIVF